jgi:hypothetical protein
MIAKRRATFQPLPGAGRARQNPTANADSEEEHRRAFLAQCANISYRLDCQTLLVNPKTERFTNCLEDNALLRWEYRKPWTVSGEV